MIMSLPQSFTEHIQGMFAMPVDEINSLFGSRPVAIRTNTLAATPDSIEKMLMEAGISCSPVQWYSDAFIISGTAAKTLTALPSYGRGEFFIQSLSSMIPALALAPNPGENVLDIAAAPGAKTSQIAALMENKGTITANDIDMNRIYKLRAVLKNQHVSNTRITKEPGQAIWKKYPEYFDKVLLDAPCSMEGRFDKEVPKTYSHWSMKKVRNLSKLQKWLLRSAVSCLKVGGSLVYSTCTLSPEENEEVIDWILSKEEGCIELENVNIAGLDLTPGLTAWGDTKFHSQLVNSKRIMPGPVMEGFYIAKLKKIAKTVSM